LIGRFLDDLCGRIDRSESGRFWLLEAPLRFEDCRGDLWTVPVGFRCDLASVPRLLRALAPSWDVTARPGVLHDHLYLTGTVPRGRADYLFFEALEAEAISLTVAWAMWAAVRIGGWRAWRLYRRHGARRREWMRPSFGDLGSDS
jgi:hypothetical protein